MSEYHATIVVCDRCHPDNLPSVAFFPIENVKGIQRDDLDTAMRVHNWVEVDYGHICPDCAMIEEGLASDGEVVLGPPAFLEGANSEDDENS